MRAILDTLGNNPILYPDNDFIDFSGAKVVLWVGPESHNNCLLANKVIQAIYSEKKLISRSHFENLIYKLVRILNVKTDTQSIDGEHSRKLWTC